MTTKPEKLIIMVSELNALRQTIKEYKDIGDKLISEFNTMDKKLSKYLDKEINNINKKKEKISKKPKGIAIPVHVSNELCKFMQQPIHTKISRTTATKFLMDYIKTNNLIDPANKKIILPNETLYELIGDEAKNDEELTRFTIQKYFSTKKIK